MVDIHAAHAEDLGALGELVAQCFPGAGSVGDPEAVARLREGIDNGWVFVATEQAEIIGFVRYERPLDHHVHLQSLAVNPDRRREGVGGKLLDHVMSVTNRASDDAVPAISAEVDRLNDIMLRLLFARSFVGRRLRRRHSPTRTTVYLHYKVRTDYVNPDKPILVSVTDDDEIRDLLARDRYVITGCGTAGGSTVFAMEQFDTDDRSGLQASEASTSVNFAGTILAAITFVLGISLASSSFPTVARMLLLVSALTTTMALVIYTNASGGIARLRSNTFDQYMWTGNILSEFGGIHPFLIALPMAFSYSPGALPAGVVMGVLFSVSLQLYESSKYSISSRFVKSIHTRLFGLVVVTAPLTGVFAIRSNLASWIWMGVLFVALSTIGIVRLRNRLGEHGVDADTGGWPVRL